MPFPLECVIARNAYGFYCIPTRSIARPAAAWVRDGKVWEQDTISLICRSVDNGDVIHAGTFFGDFLPAISKALHPSAKLWAFEPNPENFEAASMTARLNELRNIELLPFGLSEKRARRKMMVRENGQWLGGGSRILVRDPTSGDETIEINLIALDNVIPPYRRVSVLQLDVEEHENLALTGALRTISRWHPLIIIETYDEAWAATNLMPLGYRLAGKCHDNAVLSVREVSHLRR